MQTFTPRQYLHIDIANAYGKDKLTWDERLGWISSYLDRDPSLTNLLSPSELRHAEDPAAAYAGVRAYQRMLNREPSGHTIKLDATASGLQLLACLTGDRSAAELCNVLDTGTRKDAYTIVHEGVTFLCNKHDIKLSNVERADSKQALMTALYGSTATPRRVYGEGQALAAFYHVIEKYMPAAWHLNTTLVALWQALPSTGSDPQNLTNHWTLPDNFHVRIKVMDNDYETFRWNDPSGFTRDSYVKIPVHRPVPMSRSLGANIVHSIDGLIVREISRRCSYDPELVSQLRSLLDNTHKRTITLGASTVQGTPAEALLGALWDHYRATGYLSARILSCFSDGLTEPLWDMFLLLSCGHVQPLQDLLDSLPEKPFPVLSIHDAFRCHPNYVNDLRKQYNQQLMEIARSTIMDSVLTQLLDRSDHPVKLTKLDTSMWKEIMDSNYALS